jgi:anti-sigma regulatory factor (Ser/Thr protein kinase)
MITSSVFSQFSAQVAYDLNKGLPSNTAYYIFKDADGYLWITTDRGLVKYDGYSFTTYTTRDGLSDNEIFEGYQDSKKRIWFSTYNGIPTMYGNGGFYSFEQAFKAIGKPAVGPCYRIIETPGSLWFLNRKALYKFENNKIRTFDSKNMSFVSMVYHAPAEKLYVFFATSSKILCIDKTNHVDTILLPTVRTTTISKALIKGDAIFYTTWKHFCMWNLKTDSSFSVDMNSELLSVFDSGNDSILLIGSSSSVFAFNIKTKTWTEKFVDNKGISSIYAGSGGSYWTTSLNSGVSFFGNEKVSVLTDKNILPFEYVSLVRKWGDKLLIASDKFRFCIYDLKTKKVISNFNEAGDIPGRGFANAIRIANNGDVYISFRILLIKIDKNGVISRIPLKQVSYDLIYTPEYYFAMHADQMSRRESSASITDLSDDYESMAISARHLFYDAPSRIMFAYGSAGLYKVNVDSFNRVDAFTHIPELASNISSIAKYNDTVFVVGTTINGLHFITKNKLIGSLTIDEGLSSNYVHCVTIEDDEIWVGTDYGINILQLNRTTKKFDIKYLGKKDGIFSNEVNDIFIENDTIYAASPFGLFYFNKNNIYQEAELPVLNIEYVKFNNRNRKMASEIHLKSFENNLRVRFTGISYSSLGNIMYRYKLSPVDEQWHYTNTREIEYPSLGPNNYQLSIQCKGVRGDWSEVKAIRFDIAPAFWQRFEIRILIILLVAIVLGMVTRIRIRILRKRHALKEKLLKLENEKLEDIKNQAVKDKEIIELEQQALRLHMNPHFIFNAINAIQGFYAGNEVSKAKQFISYFSRLLRLILETSKEKLVPLSTEIEIIKNYLELFLLRFENKYNYHINIDEEMDEDFLMIPPMVVQPFVENAVLHGISPLKSKGEISIDFKLEENILLITIKDNGIGRKKSEELKMFSKAKSTGIKVTQMRLKHLDTRLVINQTVEIVDLEENGQSTGTMVILRVPLVNKNSGIH